MRSPACRRLALRVVVGVVPGVTVASQTMPASQAMRGAPPAAAPATPSCEGLTVTRIDIRSAPPPFEGSSARWRHMARAVGLHHATTRPGVLDAFIQLAPGDRCTDQRLAESERLVRDQPFIASARVIPVPDGAGGVALMVETTDEVPVLVGGQLHGLGLNSLSMGNGNVGGEGVLAQGYLERGFHYRTGLGARVVDYATFGRPFVTTLEAFEHPLGFHRNAEVAHPFYTDLQRVAFHAGYANDVEYRGVSRSARDPLVLRVAQHRWDATAIVRASGTHTVTLLGLGASGLQLTPGARGLIVTDSGLRADTGTALDGRYRPFSTVRLGLLGGLRRITFVPVRGFDGLTAQQDVASGIMTGAYVAHGVGGAGENDLYVSGGLYTGHATSHALFATVIQMEARRDQPSNRWDNMIGSGRAALYLEPAAGMLVTVDDRYSTGLDARLPLQLDLSDRLGGILGYRNASLAGARRNATHAEVRFVREAMVRNADVGLATFGETGTVWAGDAPYGRSATRATVGVSLLAAYPTHSKRLYRADVGIPIGRAGDGGGRVEIRFSSEDRTSAFWREPDDVSRARTGPVASTLFVTPTTH